MTLTAVTLREIERIFEILDRLGISREAVIIPLKPVHPGGVQRRRLPFTAANVPRGSSGVLFVCLAMSPAARSRPICATAF